MPIISFATPKGGSGKSTLCILLACELAAVGAKAIILDVDPQRSASQWRDRCLAEGRSLDGLAVETIADDDALAQRLEGADPFDMVLIDSQGAFNEVSALIAARSDVIVIPARASMLDVVEAAKLMRFLKAMNSPADARIVFNDIDGIAATSRAYQSAVAYVRDSGLSHFKTGILSRGLYKAAADSGGRLDDMQGDAIAIGKARRNIMQLMNEILGAVIDD
jgi:chromosome partitioning protein